jgi:hypothetical protein
MLVISQYQAQPLAHFFERMAEWAMSEIVNQSRRQSDILTAIAPWPSMLSDNPHQLTRGMKHADAMREAGMRSSGINEVGKTQLLHAPQTLKGSGRHHIPQDAFQLAIGMKRDEIVKGVADALDFHLDQIMNRPPIGST